MGLRRGPVGKMVVRKISTSRAPSSLKAKHARTTGTKGLRMALQDPAFRNLSRHLREPVEKGRWPGLAACVFVNGQLRLLEETGYADVEARTPMTKDSLMRIYSMTKCVVAAAVMQLVDDGLLNLEDDLSKHLPAFANMRVIGEGEDGLPDWSKVSPPCQPIRIRHLLTHTSGLSSGIASGIDGPKHRGARERAWAAIYGPLVQAVDSGRIKDLASWVNEVAKLPLFDQPGRHYEYGYSYDILGHIVELKTGKKLPQYLHERIFKPLGMHDTCFDISGKKSRAQRLAVLYRYTKSAKFGSNGCKPKLVRVDPPRKGAPSRWEQPCKIPSGGGALSSLEGGLLSTLDDYSKFLLAVVSHGAHPVTGGRILSPASAAKMLTDQTALLKRPGGRVPPKGANPYNDRGLGLSCLGELQRHGAPSWGKWFDGVPGVRLWGGAASTAFKYDPNGGNPILAIIMTQVLPQEDGTTIRDLLCNVREAVAAESKNAH